MSSYLFYLRADLRTREIIQVECSSAKIIQVEIIQVEFTLGENIKGGFSYQSARARTFRSSVPFGRTGREHSGRVFLLVGSGEIIQVEFSFLSDWSRTFRASVPRSETFRAS